MHKLIAAGLALAVAATPAAAFGTDAAALTEAELDKKVCKKDEEYTGSRLGARKICKTRREGLAIEGKQRPATQKTADRAASGETGSR